MALRIDCVTSANCIETRGFLCTAKATPIHQGTSAAGRLLSCYPRSPLQHRFNGTTQTSRDRLAWPARLEQACIFCSLYGSQDSRSRRKASHTSKKAQSGGAQRPPRPPKAIAHFPPICKEGEQGENACWVSEQGEETEAVAAGVVLTSFLEEVHTGGHRLESRAVRHGVHKERDTVVADYNSDTGKLGGDALGLREVEKDRGHGTHTLPARNARVGGWWRKWLPPLRTPQDAAIIGLAGPALLALAADPLLSLVDTAFVGRLGSVPLAALGVDTAVFGFSFVIFNFLATATTPLVASSLAAGNKERSGRTITQALAIAAVMGVAVSLALHFGADMAVSVMGAGDEGTELRSLALEYLQVRALAAPAVLLATVAQGSFRGIQDMKTPLAITIGANLINLVLDPILIFGLGWGVTGAGAATAVAEWASAVGYGVVMWQRRAEFGLKESVVRPALDWKRRREGLQEWAGFASAGSAVLLRTVVLLGTKTLASAVATRDGATSIAAHQVAAQLWVLGSLLVDSLAVAGQSLVAVELGAGDKQAARAISDRLLQFGLALGSALGLSYLALAPFLASTFTDDKEVLTAVDAILPIVVFMQPLNALVFVMDGLFVGASDFRYLAVAMVLSTAGSAGLLLAVEPLGWGLSGVWWALVLLMVGRGLTLGVRYNALDGPIPPVQEIEKID